MHCECILSHDPISPAVQDDSRNWMPFEGPSAKEYS